MFSNANSTSTLTAAYNAWVEESRVPTIDADWNDYSYRMMRYYLYDHWYNNTAYKAINRHASRIKVDNKLYRHIRGIYNPVQRMVEGDVSATYGGSIDLTELREGAIRVVTDDDDLRYATAQLWRWSNLRKVKSLYMRTLSKFGDALIKVVDDTESGTVRLEVLDPRKVKRIEVDAVDRVTYIEIEYPKQEADGSERMFIYRETISPTTWATYKDGELHAYGDYPAQWANPYGFVPISHAKYVDLGYRWGTNSFNTQIDKLHELNDQASLLGDSIRAIVQPLYSVEGGAPGTITTNADEPTRDTIRMVYLPTGTNLQPINAPVDIPGVTSNIQMMLDELQRDVPTLALHSIREHGALTRPGVESGFSDALRRLEDVMGNADAALIEATRMGVAIAAMRRYAGFNRFNLGDFTAGGMQFHIKPRDIIRDGMTRMERVQLLSNLDPNNPLTPLILEEMGYKPDAIRRAEERAVASRQSRLREDMVRQQQQRAIALEALGQQIRGAASNARAEGE